ncbi:MAG TPA: hypothetical protein VJ579_02030 [Candidatus Paceibacterota bacterium]|nr:hypothetical protein [Candidatus Paceibacterota bacterium]
MSHHPLLIVKARHVVRHSHLSDEDKQLMFERIPYLDLGMLALFIESAEENPFALDAIVSSMKKKLDARGNLHRLHEILENEEKEIADEEGDETLPGVELNNSAAI